MDVSMKLRSQLEELEKKALGEKSQVSFSSSSGSQTKSLEEIYKTKEICGMPLNMTLTDIDRIIQQVKNTVSYLNTVSTEPHTN
jgi:hypothetical protein